MSDIVERLRADWPDTPDDDRYEAANVIDGLRHAASVALAMLDPENQPPQFTNAEAREIIREALGKESA